VKAKLNIEKMNNKSAAFSLKGAKPLAKGQDFFVGFGLQKNRKILKKFFQDFAGFAPFLKNTLIFLS
jgi:hypothetical protein